MLVLLAIYAVGLNVSINRLEKLAWRDGLTGLYNRRAGEDALRIEVMRAVRGGHFLAVVYLDFNNFKAVNDRLGHRHGDEVLRGGARMIVANTRLGDVVVRNGGDEVYIICPDTDADGATKLMDKLVASVRLEPTYHGEPIPVTLSAGMASLNGKSIPWQTLDDGSAVAQELLHLADERMFFHKRQTRVTTDEVARQSTGYKPE
jgi:diguanylate cyclase (GGDEF)-like protein